MAVRRTQITPMNRIIAAVYTVESETVAFKDRRKFWYFEIKLVYLSELITNRRTLEICQSLPRKMLKYDYISIKNRLYRDTIDCIDELWSSHFLRHYNCKSWINARNLSILGKENTKYI